LPILNGKSGDMQLMMIDKNNQSCNVKLLHDRNLEVDSGGNFTTVSEKISCSLSVNKFVLYLNKPSSYSWVLENSVTINIYNFKTNKLLATTVIGKQDSIVRLGVSKYKDRPSIVLSKCDPDIDFDLNDEFVKIEIVSMCDQNASPCCDALPTQVSVSGYSTLCIPLNEFYTIPDYPSATTTPAPYSAPAPTISLLDDLAVKQSSGIPYYVVDAHISTSDGSDFSYWWERSENNRNWQRITDLKTEKTETLVALKEVKRRDYYYRLYFESPQRKRSNIAFFDYPDPAPTTSTSTTTAAPLVHPNSPTSVDASGGGFRKVHLSWKAPTEDDRAPVSGYRILANTIASTSPYSSNYTFKTEVSASTTGYFQPVAQLYDGITLHYCVSAANFFGFSEVACDSAATISTEPPTVSNLIVTPDDTGGVDGFFLNWHTGGVNEVYPLVSHKIRHRTSGTADTYSVINYPVADLSVTQVKVTGLFDNCEQIEFLVDAESTIGMSVIPATGYGLYAFLPHAPTNLSLVLEDAGLGDDTVKIDIGWTEPTDSGRCGINSYVLNYRLAGSTDWGPDINFLADGSTHALTPETTNPNTYSVQTENVASGIYEARVAAITIDGEDNIVGTGTYGGVSAATIVKLDFDDWVANTGTITPHYYHIENKSLYVTYGDIITENDVTSDGQAANNADPLYARAQGAKFGTYGFYGSSLGFACPEQSYVSPTADNDQLYPYKLVRVAFDNLSDQDGTPQFASQDHVSLTNSATRLNDDSDGETRSTMECWFKLPTSGPEDDTIDTTLTNTDIGIMGTYLKIDPAPFNTSNFPLLDFDLNDGTDYSMGYPENMYKSIDILGDYIFGSGLRLKLEHRIYGGSNLGTDYGWEGGGGGRAYVNNSVDLIAPHPNYINDTEWHHLAVVSSGNNLKFYVDGTGIIDHDYTCNIGVDYDSGAGEYNIVGTGIDIPSYFGYLVAGTDTTNALYSINQQDDPQSSQAFCVYLDEVRLTRFVAYSGNFDVPTEPLT